MAQTLINNLSYSTLDATKLTGNLPAISGASLTGITTGKVGQVVNDASTSVYSTNSTSYVSIFTPSFITPSATTSKILVSWQCSMAVLSNTSNLGHFVSQREIQGGSYDYLYNSGHNSSMHTLKADGNKQGYGLCFQFLDSPNTTSPVRYYVQHKTDNTGMTIYINSNQGGQGGYMFLTQMEILA